MQCSPLGTVSPSTFLSVLENLSPFWCISFVDLNCILVPDIQRENESYIRARTSRKSMSDPKLDLILDPTRRKPKASPGLESNVMELKFNWVEF